MATSPDWSRARILVYDRQPARNTRLCLLWPAWVYRVTAPVLERRGLDLFERVTLALCQAGVRQPDRIGTLVELDPRLCAHLLDRAVKDGLLDARHEVTDRGREALRTGMSAQAAQWQVCYVFEDPFTGELWPRTVEALRDAYVRRVEETGAEVELGSAGRSDRVAARRVPPPARAPQRPGAARVIEASSADRAARRIFQVREYERRAGLDPATAPDDLTGSRGAGVLPDQLPELHRVAFLGEPEPVFLVGFLDVSGAGAESAEGWTAYDPFGLGPSDVFQSLVYRFGRDDGWLDEEISARAAAELTAARNRYRQADQDLRDLLEQRLAHEFGPEVRDDADAFDLMLTIDLAAELPTHEESLERVAQTALRLYEVLLSRMLVAYPVAPDLLRTFARTQTLRRAMLEEAAQRTGFHHVATIFADVREDELTRTSANPAKGFVKGLFPLSLLAAGRHPDHPLRTMAAEQPDLAVTLATLNTLRNRGAHAERDAANPHDATWCRSVAATATRALLRLPEPSTERIQP